MAHTSGWYEQRGREALVLYDDAHDLESKRMLFGIAGNYFDLARMMLATEMTIVGLQLPRDEKKRDA